MAIRHDWEAGQRSRIACLDSLETLRCEHRQWPRWISCVLQQVTTRNVLCPSPSYSERRGLYEKTITISIQYVTCMYLPIGFQLIHSFWIFLQRLFKPTTTQSRSRHSTNIVLEFH